MAFEELRIHLPGGELGVAAETRVDGWYVSATGKVALGALFTSADAGGSTVTNAGVDASGFYVRPAVAGRRLKIKYLTQAKTRPPGFVVSCSRPDAMPQSYVRYLVNSLRDAFDMPGVPIRVALRTSENPFAGRARKKG